MATVEDYDKELARLKAQMEKVKERKKAALAKERERNRKWQAECVTAIGEAVLKAANCKWMEFDIESFALWLDENAATLKESCIDGRMSAVDAKKLLDRFKSKPAKKKENEIAKDDALKYSLM